MQYVEYHFSGPFKPSVFYMGIGKQNSTVCGVQYVAFIIGFIYGQSIFFESCDCISEGVVPANTLKRLVRKRENKNTYFIKNVFGGRIQTPTDKE